MKIVTIYLKAYDKKHKQYLLKRSNIRYWLQKVHDYINYNNFHNTGFY